MEKKHEKSMKAMIIFGNLICSVLLFGSVFLDQFQWGMNFLKYWYLWIVVTFLLSGIAIVGEWAIFSMKKKIGIVLLMCIESICLAITYYLLMKLKIYL